MAFEKRNFIFALAVGVVFTLLTGWFAAKAHTYFTASASSTIIALGPCAWERRFVIPCADCSTHTPNLAGEFQ